MADELTFPRTFNACPVCQSKRGCAGMVAEAEQKAHRMSENINGAAGMIQNVIMDPNRPIVFSVKLLSSFLEVCYDCGTVYAKHVTVSDQKMDIKPPNGNNPRLFNNPKYS